MNIIKSIVERLKIKELFAILFIAALIVTFLPSELAVKMQIDVFRENYQTHISLCLILIGAYYVLEIFQWLRNKIKRSIYNEERVAIKYMKSQMNADEMQLLIEVFYDTTNCRFRGSGCIDLNDGRKAALESRYVIYRAASVSSFYTMFAYNLQPYALEFLNENLNSGNIQISESSFKYNLK